MDLRQKQDAIKEKSFAKEKKKKVLPETESLWPDTNRKTLNGAENNNNCLLLHR